MVSVCTWIIVLATFWLCSTSNLVPLVLQIHPGVAKEGSTVSLSCSSIALPAPIRYTWKKNGHMVDVSGEHIRASSTGNMLTIASVTVADSGYYQCAVSSEQGLGALSDVSRLIVIPSNLSEIRGHKQAFDGQPFILSCLTNLSMLAPGAQLTYTWHKFKGDEDRRPEKALAPSYRISPDSNTGHLYFAYANKTEDQSKSDSYFMYRCTARFLPPYNDTKQDCDYTLDIVPPVSTGSVNASVSPVIAFVRQDAYLYCFFSGSNSASKPADVTWSRMSDRSSLLLNGALLKITNVSLADSGTYVCTNTADPGMPTHQLTLTVVETPNIQDSLVVSGGDTMSVQCQPQATPSVSAQWFVNGKPADSNTAYEVAGNSLTVARPGLWCLQCNASNDYGYVFSTAYIYVIGNASRTITEPCAVMADTSLAIVIIIIVLLALLIVLMLVYYFLYRHRGRSYYVGEKKDPNSFQPYQPSANGQAGTTPVPLRHVQFGDSSLSLNEYAEIDPSQFLEDGSFNGAYVNRSFRMK